MADDDKSRGRGARARAQDKDKDQPAPQEGVQVEPIADAEGSRTGPEAELVQSHAQPPPDLEATDAMASRGQVVGAPEGVADPKAEGEGAVGRAEGVAAAQAGNEEVAARFQPELEAGWRGTNPSAADNVEHTVAGHLAFQKLSPEEQYERRRELHLKSQENLRGDDWS